MYGWGDEDDEGPDPDYGIWGDADLPKPQPDKRDPRRERDIARAQRERNWSIDASRKFNSYMIELFNERAKR